MITVSQLRADYPEFASTSVYPNSQVQYYLNFATLFLNQDRWGTPSTGSDPSQFVEWDFGAELFIAHHLALEAIDQAEAKNGSPPGIRPGAISAESADKVSVSYDVNSTLDEGAGHWNLTVYGKRFIRLARMMGAGPIQLGVVSTFDPLSSQNAWPGPWFANTPNPSDS